MYITTAAITILVLLSAAVSDWRRREASDFHWIILMGMGAILLGVRLHEDSAPWLSYLSMLSIALMAVDLFWERETGFSADIVLYTSIAITSIVSAFALRDSDLIWVYVSIPAAYVAMNVLYYTGIVRGGADAKAIIAIACAFPSYPEFGQFPIIGVPSGDLPLFAVPAFSVFMVAAVLTIMLFIPYLIVNLSRGDIRFPMMLAGFTMDISKAKDSHVWPMEDVDDGNIIRNLAGFDDPEVYGRLEEHGEGRVWVTPVIPFLIPILISFVIVVFLGSPLFAFTG